MTREEYLLDKFSEMSKAQKKNKIAFYTSPSVAYVEPFKIADDLYYVGDKKVCVHLIDSGDGLILIDSGYPCATHLLIDSIWRAGFDPKDVRYIIHTHGHWDHFGASEEFRNLYGTRLAISRVDGEKIMGTDVSSESFPFMQVPKFDHFIEDGEIFALGRVKIRCILTPGHTDGVLSLFFEVTDNGNTYLAGMLGGAGVNAIKLPYICRNKRQGDPIRQMLNSIERIWDEPVAVHLGNHPGNNKTLQKREKQLKEGGNPFVDPDSWRTFLSGLRANVEEIAKDNERLEEEIQKLISSGGLND